MTAKSEATIEGLRELVLRMGALAEAILAKALRVVRERDARLASEVQRDDLELDKLDIEIDDAVLRALALQSPVAEDLRQVVAIKTMATDLERVGDIARNIAKSGARLAERPRTDLPMRLEPLEREATNQLAAALDSFQELNVVGAQAVLDGDDRLDRMQDTLVRELIARIERDSGNAAQTLDIIFIAESLERIGDHATNVAEEVILVAEARNVKHAEKLARYARER
ncbi:MAG TPA: phosphate signaling complex protein PhoU [Myxococcota bacterium]|nr:phosphate signaling complex protein PhoU [Myxococcota bacterium]